MRNIKYLTVMLICTILACSDLLSITMSITTKGKEEKLDPGGAPPILACPDDGKGCWVSCDEGEKVSSIEYLGSNNYKLTTYISLKGEIERANESIEFNPIQTITFVSGETVRITSSTEYPDLVGELIDLNGITTGTDGSYSVYFTKN